MDGGRYIAVPKMDNVTPRIKVEVTPKLENVKIEVAPKLESNNLEVVPKLENIKSEVVLKPKDRKIKRQKRKANKRQKRKAKKRIKKCCKKLVEKRVKAALNRFKRIIKKLAISTHMHLNKTKNHSNRVMHMLETMGFEGDIIELFKQEKAFKNQVVANLVQIKKKCRSNR